MSDKKGLELVERGNKEPSPLGSATFVGLRLLDPFLQYGILSDGIGTGLISLFGSSVLTQGPAAETGTPLDSLNLSTYRLALLGMSAGSFLKQAFWRLFLQEEPMRPSVAALLSIFDSAFNSANSLIFICAATSAAKYIGDGPHSSHFPGRALIVGSVLFVAGVLTETTSEVQRALFKRKKENQGRPYTGGIWSFTRHPNYLGYTTWRAGFALASGGWLWGTATGLLFATDFITRAIPELEQYCENRYADMWHLYQERTPYKFLPFVY